MAKRDVKGFLKAVAKADKKYGAKTTQQPVPGKRTAVGNMSQMTKVPGKRGTLHAARVKGHTKAMVRAGKKYGVHGAGGYTGGSSG